MNNRLAKSCSRVYPHLPALLIVLCCFQPVLDILSYWQDALALPFSLSFLPRTIVMVLLGVGGFVLSERKRAYVVMAGVLAVFLGCHVYACYTNGFTDMVNDISNYIRVLQLPVTTLCLITCLRCNENCLDAIERGIFYSLLLLAASFVVSIVTGTDPHTYTDRGVGIRGYAFWANSQSAILSLAAPISIAYMLKKHADKPLWCILTMVLSLLLLFVHGTRLSFLCMVMTGAGMTLVLLLTRTTPKKYIWILAGLTLLSAGCFKLSPMYENQQDVASYTQVKADASASLLKLGKAQVENGNSPVLISRELANERTGMEAFALAAPLSSTSFNDVAEDDWCSEYLGYIQTLGLANGVNSTYDFAPDDELTALAAITFCDHIYERYYGAERAEYVGYDGKTWYEVYFLRAEAYGLMPELVWLDDEPNVPVSTAEQIGEDALFTRAQAAGLLARTLARTEFPEIHAVGSIPDVTPDTPYYEDILLLARAGILVGPGDERSFRPNEPATRREFAALLAAALNPAFRLADAGKTPQPVQTASYDTSALSETDRREAELYPLYNYFCTGLVSKFGVHATMDAYEYTTDVPTLISERTWKLQFCYLLMESSTAVSRVFGLEVSRMAFNGTIYDVENDFHAMYLLYGIVGLALMLLFLGYFVFLILRALLKNFRQVFTLEAGAVGIALIACVLHAYFTCGVLRRANVLFYFGALLAAAYYLTKIKTYPKQ